MRITHSPYQWLTVANQQRAFIILTLLTLLLMFTLSVIDRPLQNPTAPQGIVSFELAGNLVRAQEILQSWGPDGQIYAGLSLGLDFLYLVAYAGSIGLGAMVVVQGLGKRTGTMTPTLGLAVAWALIVAGLLDAVENFALIQLLLGATEPFWPPLAKGCALVKFTLVALGLLYFIFGGLISIIARISRRVENETAT